MREDQLRALTGQLLAELHCHISDADEREPVQKVLTAALELPAGTAEEGLRTALRSHPATRAWVRQHTDVSDDTERMVGPLGAYLGGGGLLFVCPRGDYSVVRETISADVLFCPNDNSVLERHTS